MLGLWLSDPNHLALPSNVYIFMVCRGFVIKANTCWNGFDGGLIYLNGWTQIDRFGHILNYFEMSEIKFTIVHSSAYSTL